MRVGRAITLACSLALAATPALANGHGPVFGLATPTNGKGTWTLDFAPMFRAGRAGEAEMMRAMLTYGITANWEISFSAPAMLGNTRLPTARLTGMMPANGEFEMLTGWRFQRQEPAVGLRRESTAYFGVDLPGPEAVQGKGAYAAVATGLASRTNYLWIGAGDQYLRGTSRGPALNTAFYSLVYGYRPLAARQHYPGLDWRFFAELTGEHGSAVRISHDQVFLGPSVLLIHKDIGLSAGVQWPIYTAGGRQFGRERNRVVVDVSYFF